MRKRALAIRLWLLLRSSLKILESYPNYEENGYNDWAKWIWSKEELETMMDGLRAAGLDMKTPSY